MNWFGVSWGAPICEEVTKVDIPVGEPCFHCGGRIQESDRGLVLPFLGSDGVKPSPWHLVCFIKAIT